MTRTLLHKDEIKHRIKAAKSLSGEVFEADLCDIEEDYFNGLSWSFYQLLLADVKAEYWEAIEYKHGESYALGDVRIYDGLFYCADKDTCEQPPCDWTLKCKFNAECYCIIWEKYLCKILSTLAVLACSDDINTKITAKGIGIGDSDSFGNYDYKQLTQWAVGKSKKVETTVNNMIRFIWRDTSGCYDSLKECLPCPPDCEPCGKLPTPVRNNAFPIIGNLPECWD